MFYINIEHFLCNMTRINCSIPVSSLTDEHLLAEHREIKRLPVLTLKAINSGNIYKAPNEFCLETGHVLFFCNYGKYTLNRYIKLYNECIYRGFNVEDYRSNWSFIPHEFMNDLEENTDIKEIISLRIKDRIKNSKKSYFHYKRTKISKETAYLYLDNERLS